MGLTLGLDNALSGLLTSQEALNTVSQNITNVNTQGYTRKVQNLKSQVLNGQGAGVQNAGITRNVDIGLNKQINVQSSTMGNLNTLQTYYQSIEAQFGNVGDGSSIADQLGTMTNGFQQLSSDPTQIANQTAAVQNALNATGKLNTMTSSIQSLRLQADTAINQGISQINTDLTSINDLNQKITRNLSVGQDATNLQDQRDAALTDVNKYMSVKSYVSNNGALQVYTATGVSLVDNQAHLLTHAAISQSASWMTLAGGQFNGITVGASPADISATITTGQLGGLLTLRDTTLVNLQSQIDTTAQKLQTAVNAASNQGTTFPNASSSYTGSRVFANQGHVAVSSGDTTAVVTYNQGTGSLGAGALGSLGFSYSATSGQAVVSSANTGALSALAQGSTFSITGSVNSSNDGTYTVLSNDGTNVTVSRGNPVQTFSLANNADVAVGIFDSSGTQVSTASLNTIMTTDYSNGSTTAPQLQAQADHGPWSMDSMTQHLQSWARAQGNIYQSATVGLNAQGQVAINLGSTVNQSLTFRDQVSGVNGAAAQSATINFDTNGDGTPDQTFSGFSNFLGLNDMLVTNQANANMDSNVLATNFATNQTRTISLSDTTGQIGGTITIPSGSSLTKIASLINSFTATTESSAQANQSLTISTAATISVNNPSGVVSTLNLPAGTYTMQDIAARLTQQAPGEVTATSVQSSSMPPLYTMRLTDAGGVPLQVTITGGVYNGNSTLSAQLNFAAVNNIRAEVIPEGSGQRLRILNGTGNQLFASGNQDGSGHSILTDLGLTNAATTTASNLTVRSDIQKNPQLISRGAVQWNATTSQYYLSAGDNTSAQALATAMTTNQDMPTSGDIAAGSYTFSSYAAATISNVATSSANVTSNQTYQQTLTSTLNTQFSSTSGVNLDQEVSSMMDYQQAYSASARVISVLQSMLTTLVDIIH
jgi:flagellar hook-associated protein 1